MKFTFVKKIIHYTMLLLVLGFVSCVSEKKASKAECGILEVFDTRSQSCIAVSNPLPGLTNVSVAEDSGETILTLSYNPPNGAIAIDCRVTDLYTEVEFFSPLKASAISLAQSTGASIASSVALMTTPTAPATAAAITAVEQAAITGVAKSQAQLVTALTSLLSNASTALTAAAADSGSAVSAAAAQAQVDTLSSYMATILNACQCSAGVCKTIVTPTENEFGFFDFNYSITDTNGKTGTTNVGLTVTSVNDKPVTVHKHVISDESNSSSATPVNFTLPLARDVESDFSAAITYTLQASPGNGLVFNCMGLAGSTSSSDRTCTYLPTSGDAFGTATYGSASIQDLSYSVLSKLDPGHNFTVEYKDYPLNNPSQPIVEVTDQRDVVVLIDSGITTASNIQAAVLADYQASSILSVTVTGVSTTAQVVQGAVILTGFTPPFDSMTFSAFDGSDSSEFNGVISFGLNSVDDLPVGSSVVSLTSAILWEEDTPQTVVLSYTDVENDLATSCNVFDLNNLISTSTCSCVAGVCGVGLVGTQDYNGLASYSFTVSYAGATSLTATVAVVINGVNDPPTPSVQNHLLIPSVESSTSVAESIDFTLSNAFDPDNNSLTYEVVTAPVNGSLTNCMNLPGSTSSSDLSCTFTPVNGNISGEGSFSTGTLASSLTVYTLSVGQFNGASESLVAVNLLDGAAYGVIAGSETVEVLGSGPININIRIEDGISTLQNVKDAIEASSSASKVVFLIASGALTSAVSTADSIVLVAGTDAADKFTYKVSDGSSDSYFNATVGIRISDTNDVPIVCDYDKYEEARECGLSGCIGTIAPVGLLTPTAVGNIFYQSGAATCYISNGTDSFHDWEIISDSGDFFKDRIINQKDIVVIDTLRIDEGGGSGENAETLTLLEVESSNTILIPENSTNIKFLYNSAVLAGTAAVFDGSTAVGLALGDGFASGDSVPFEMRIIPVSGTFGDSTITVYLGDSTGGVTQAAFRVSVGSVGASHNGWSNIKAQGPKRDKYSQLSESSNICDYSKTRCSGGECIGTNNPNVAALVPDSSTSNTVYYNSASDSCYYFDSSQSAGSQWVNFSSYCHISDSFYDANCSGGSCIGSGAPGFTPSKLNTFFYDKQNSLCYRSMDTISSASWVTYTAPSEVELSWEAMSVSGAGTITGYNVYRRITGESFDYDSPINKTNVGAASRSYTDNAANSLFGPIPNTVYYYEVRPIITSGSPSVSLVTSTEESYKTVRVLVPNDNHSFVHRWIVNKTTCEKMNATLIDKSNDFRCEYSGPGDVNISGINYYDFGKDLIVERFEAGCRYSLTPACGGLTADGNCIGLTDPSTSGFTPSVGTTYYNRSNGICYKYSGSWDEFDGSSTLEDHSVAALPPLVMMEQSQTYHFCAQSNSGNILGLCQYSVSAAGVPAGDVADGTIFLNTLDTSCWVESGAGVWTKTYSGGYAAKRLPTRKEQMAYSEWNTDSLSHASITALEAGLSLNSSSKCNGTSSNGLISGYTDTDSPNVSNLFSLPGSSSSGIRSIATGSIETASCSSRYGIQDVVGNVKEWVSERVECYDTDPEGMGRDKSCRTLNDEAHSLGRKTEMRPTDGCPYSVSIGCNGSAGESACMGDLAGMTPATAARVTAPGVVGNGAFYFDTSNGNCFEVIAGAWVATSTIDTSGPKDPYASFMLNGIIGPCIDNDVNGVCDGDLGSWRIDSESFGANRFIISMGLPAEVTFPTTYTTSAVKNHLVEIGPTSGITTSALHEDTMEFNMSRILDTDNTLKTAGFSTGGSYLTGNGAGVYHFELVPSQDTDSSDGEIHRRVDLGFRCVAPVGSGVNSQYLE